MTPLLRDFAAWWLQSGLLLLAGLLLPAVLRLSDPRVRLRLGQLLLAAAILLPVVQSRPRAETAARGTSSVGILPGAPIAPGTRPDLERLFVSVLVTGAVLRLARVAAGLRKLAAVRRRATPFDSVPPGVSAALDRSGLLADVLVSTELASPITVGVFRPAILFPLSFAGLPAREQEAIAFHELAHVARGDARAVLLEEIARTLLWHQPAAWAVLSRVRLAREECVDREVVAATRDVPSYVRALAATARIAAAAPASALAFHAKSHVVRRISRLVKEVPMKRSRLVLLTAAAGIVLVAVAAAGVLVFPLAGALPAPDEPAANSADKDGTFTEPVRLTDPRPVYPPEAKAKGIEGVVKLSVTVDEKGAVSSVEPVWSPDASLTAAAVDAVRKWTFRPATKDGKPVKVKLTIAVRFALPDGPA